MRPTPISGSQNVLLLQFVQKWRQSFLKLTLNIFRAAKSSSHYFQVILCPNYCRCCVRIWVAADIYRHLSELRQRVEEALFAFLYSSEKVVLHLQAVVLELGVVVLELAHQLLVLLHL